MLTYLDKGNCSKIGVGKSERPLISRWSFYTNNGSLLEVEMEVKVEPKVEACRDPKEFRTKGRRKNGWAAPKK